MALTTFIPSMIIEPRCEKKRYSGFPTRSDTNRTVHSQKMARDLKFRFKEVEGLYYLCSENSFAVNSLFSHMQRSRFSHDGAHISSCRI